jgi:hypothetical protein
LNFAWGTISIKSPLKPSKSGTNLSDRLEILNVIAGHLGDLEKSDSSLIVDKGTTLNIGFRLVRNFHEELRLRVNHVLEDVAIDSSSEIIDVGNENVLFALFEKSVE